jgi:hypothetical protein
MKYQDQVGARQVPAMRLHQLIGRDAVRAFSAGLHRIEFLGIEVMSANLVSAVAQNFGGCFRHRMAEACRRRVGDDGERVISGH